MHVVKSRQMAQISETRSPQGIAAVVPLLEPPAPRRGERAIYLHEIQDPGNLGTILRTLAWFGNFRCLLSPDSVDLYNGKAVRASMGAIFHVPVEMDVQLESLPARYPRIACLDLTANPSPRRHSATSTAIVFGNEARGLPQRSPGLDEGAGPSPLRGTRCHRIAQRGSGGEHLPVRIAPRGVGALSSA